MNEDVKPGAPKRFWMIYSPSGRAPTFTHQTRESANKEARRLANENDHCSFYVLEAVALFKIPRPDVLETPLELPALPPPPHDDDAAELEAIINP